MNTIALDAKLETAVLPHHLRPGRAGFWPVLLRELRTESRRASNYGLRLLGAVALTVLFAMLLHQESQISIELSIRLFTGAHTLLLAGIWLVGPALTADAISRERREGTLSLLFASNLTAREIVLGKSWIHILRLVTLWLAALPILMIPILFGGVTQLDMVSALSLEACAVLLALGAGLATSAFLRHPVAALLAAEAVGVVFFFGFRALLGTACILQLNPLVPGSSLQFTRYELLTSPLGYLTGMAEGWGWSSKIRILGPAGQHVWLAVLVEMFTITLLVFLAVLVMAAHRTQRVWQETPLSTRQLRRRQIWLAPRFWLGRFARHRERWLARNPLGWVEQRSIWTRVSKLGWCGLVLFWESLLMLSREPWHHYDRVQLWLSILLSLGMTFAAVMTFRRERDSGVLELLLVTPISVEQIIYRQVCGFWRRFLPPVLLQLGLAKLMIILDMANSGGYSFQAFLLLNLLTIPLIGFYSSARFQNFTAAALSTAFFSLALPLFWPDLGPGFIERLASLDLWFLQEYASPAVASDALPIVSGFLQLIAAAVCGCWLWQSLLHRSFLPSQAA